MCLSAVYLELPDEKKLVMERVAHLRVLAEGIELEDLLGRTELVPGAYIASVDLMENVIYCRK